MKLTNEQLTKVKQAKNAEELLALAKAEGIEMSEEEIKARFAEMHKEGELADDELDNVTGGCGEDEKPYDPHLDENYVTEMYCFQCGHRNRWSGLYLDNIDYECPKCHTMKFSGVTSYTKEWDRSS